MKKILIGLGNPDKEYEFTYHNAGALALSYLAKNFGKKFGVKKSGKNKDFSFMEFHDPGKNDRLILVWPKTYMNESGVAVRSALKFFNAKPEEMFIFHDDSDLMLGTIKESKSENTAGHHGLISVQNETGSKNFKRVRIGIRDPKEKIRAKAEMFVLKRIPASKLKVIYLAAEEASEKVIENSTP